MKTNPWLLGLAATGVIAVVAGLFILDTGSGAARDVEIREDGAVKSSAQEDDAVAEVSQRVGFEVKVPTRVPDGLELAFVDSTIVASGAANGLKLAFLSYSPKDEARSADVSVRIEQTGTRFSAPDGRAVKIDLGVPGTEAYYQITERATGYWLFTADRGFLVTVIGASPPSDTEMREMVASLAR